MERFFLVYADDDASVQSVIAESLRLDGMDVHCCANGAEAVELCERLYPDAVLLDLDMPCVDGFEAARRIRAGAAVAGIRLVAYTGNPDHGSMARLAGFDAFIVKPATVGALKTAICCAVAPPTPTLVRRVRSLRAARNNLVSVAESLRRVAALQCRRSCALRSEVRRLIDLRTFAR